MPRKRSCDNPEMLAILEEELEKAQAKEEDRPPAERYLSRSYKKAIDGLVAWEGVLDPHDSKQVPGIGDKIRSLLVSRMNKRGGDDSSQPQAGPSQPKATKATKKAAAKAPAKKKRKAADSSSEDDAPAPKKSKSKGKGKAPARPAPPPDSSSSDDAPSRRIQAEYDGASEWQPEFGKPSCAVLLGLWEACTPTDQSQVLSQTAVLARAQKFSRTELTKSTAIVTSANSFSTLLSKQKIVRVGESYALTPAGFELAQEVVKANPRSSLKPIAVTRLQYFKKPAVEPPAPARAPARPAPTRPAGSAKRPRPIEDEYDLPIRPPSPPRRVSNAFGYVFLDESALLDDLGLTHAGNVRVHVRAQADASQHPEDEMAIYKIEFRQALRSHDHARKLMLVEPLFRPTPGNEGSTCCAWIRSADCSERSPGFFAETVVPAPAAAPEPTPADLRAQADRADLMAGRSRAPPKDPRAIYKLPEPARDEARARAAAAAQSRSLGASSSMPEMAPPSRPTLPVPSSSAPRASTSRATAPAPQAGPSRPRYSASNASFDPRTFTSMPLSVRDTIAVPPFKPADALVMRPGEFTVKMVLDNREHKHLAGLVGQKEVPYTQQQLPLGDVIWIAERKQPSGRPDEDVFVLDGILERKRASDLVSSIKDGRYDEQKARMRASGMTRLYFLIEMWGMHKVQMQAWDQQYWTVASQSQVIDGFSVSIHDKVEHARTHLINMTKIFAELYESTTIYAIPSRFVKRDSYVSLQKHLRKTYPDQPFLTTYSGYAEASELKHTIGMEYASMLLCQSGYSAEKVVDVVQQWPTMHSLWTDLDRRRREVEIEQDAFDHDPPPTKGRKKSKRPTGEDYVQSVIGRDSSRSVKGKLSKDTWELYTSLSYV